MYKLGGQSRNVSILKRKKSSSLLNVVARSNKIRYRISAKRSHLSARCKAHIEVGQKVSSYAGEGILNPLRIFTNNFPFSSNFFFFTFYTLTSSIILPYLK